MERDNICESLPPIKPTNDLYSLKLFTFNSCRRIVQYFLLQFTTLWPSTLIGSVKHFVSEVLGVIEHE